MNTKTTSKLLLAGLVAGIGGYSAQAGSISSVLAGLAPTPFTSQIDFNDDSAGNFLAPNGDVIAPQAINEAILALAASDQIVDVRGVFTIGDIGGVNMNTPAAPFEVTGVYELTLTSYNAVTDRATFNAKFSIYEDITPDANITEIGGLNTTAPGTFSDGSLFAVLESNAYTFLVDFDGGGFFNSASLVPVNQPLAITGGSILSDPNIVNPSVVAEATTISIPSSLGNTSFTLTDSAVFVLTATIVPSPSAMAFGLFGLGAVAMRRRRK